MIVSSQTAHLRVAQVEGAVFGVDTAAGAYGFVVGNISFFKDDRSAAGVDAAPFTAGIGSLVTLYVGALQAQHAAGHRDAAAVGCAVVADVGGGLCAHQRAKDPGAAAVDRGSVVLDVGVIGE